MRTAILLFAILPALTKSNSIMAGERYDLILKNGRIVDGAGTPWYIADVAIRDR